MSRLGAAVHQFSHLPSTNLYLRQMAGRFPDGIVVMADHQSAGRGRNGRTWVDFDTAGASLLFSVGIIPNIPAEHLTWLTMLAGIAIIEAIPTIPLCLKWPNDIIFVDSQQRWHKLGGILVEAGLDNSEVEYAIIGIGLNCTLSPKQLATITADLSPHHLPPTSLSVLTDTPIEQTVLLSAILDRLGIWITAAEQGDSPHATWQTHLAGIGQSVTIGDYTGRFTGVDLYGQALLDTVSGKKAIPSGDLSLRPAL